MCVVEEAGGVVADVFGEGHDAVELITGGEVDLVVNSPRGRGPRADGRHIRQAAAAEGVPLKGRSPGSIS